MLMGFPGGSVVKSPPANAATGFSSLGPGRLVGEGNGNPLQISWLGNHGQRSLQGYIQPMVSQKRMTTPRLNNNNTYYIGLL